MSAGSARRPVTPETILRQVVVEDHALDPDGSLAVVVRRSIHDGAYRSHLWRVPLAARRRSGERVGALTRGAVRDTVPRVSPDGTRLAFIRSWPDDVERPAAVFVMAIAGGEPSPLIVPEHGVSEIAWSPDGRRLAYVTPSDPPRFAVGELVTGRAPVARRIRTLGWRWDQAGYLDRWDHLWVVPIEEGASSLRLTWGDWGVRRPAWSPDGREIAFVADRQPDTDRHPRPAIHVVPADGGEPRPLVELAGRADAPTWSPDGRFVACIGVDVADPLDDVLPGVFVTPADGSRPPVAHAPDLDRPVGTVQFTDLNGWTSEPRPGPAWLGPDRIVALVSDRGRAVPFGFPVDGSTGNPAGPALPMTRQAGRATVADAACWTLSVANGIVAVTGTLDARPQELLVLHGGVLRAATTMGSAWRRGLLVPEMRRIAAPGDGGPIEGWLACPPGASDRMLPLVVDIHGGPLGAWAPAPPLEVHMLVAQGYRVLLPDIRGSSSYGAAWIRPQLGDAGGVDAADVHAAVDYVIALGLADPHRLGVMGVSYGGFLVDWLVATSDRFRAAVTENGTSNQVSTWANSDSGPEYCRSALLGDTLSPAGVAKLWSQSPLAHVAEIRTPLLILQAEEDHTCPPADAEQLFVALRALGRTVEYVLYPEESHTFHISGRPDRRVDRMRRVLDWFADHLDVPSQP